MGQNHKEKLKENAENKCLGTSFPYTFATKTSPETILLAALVPPRTETFSTSMKNWRHNPERRQAETWTLFMELTWCSATTE